MNNNYFEKYCNSKNIYDYLTENNDNSDSELDPEQIEKINEQELFKEKKEFDWEEFYKNIDFIPPTYIDNHNNIEYDKEELTNLKNQLINLNNDQLNIFLEEEGEKNRVNPGKLKFSSASNGNMMKYFLSLRMRQYDNINMPKDMRNQLRQNHFMTLMKQYEEWTKNSVGEKN